MLADLLWAQYCLFMFVRLQDDLYDGHVHEPSLIYLADQYLIECQRTLGSHFPRSARFWELFYEGVETTTRAILRVDALERHPHRRGRELAAGYAEVASVLKVGAAAACLKFGRPGELATVSRFADAMAVAGQIVDDLEDVADDLGRGRFNYVAQLLLDGRRADPTQASRLIAAELLVRNGLSRVMRVARTYVTRARGLAARLQCSEAAAHAASAAQALDAMEARMERRTAEVVFARR